MSHPGIGSTRIVLRSPRLDDAPALANMMTPTVSRGLGSWPVPFTPVMAAERIAEVSQAEARGLGLPRVIERRADSTVLGWVSVSRPSGEARRAILSYWLGEAYHGQGIMRQAVPAMVALAFRAWKLDAFEASTHPENVASAKVLQSCGFRPIGKRAIFASARQREELCLVFELLRAAVGADETVGR